MACITDSNDQHDTQHDPAEDVFVSEGDLPAPVFAAIKKARAALIALEDSMRTEKWANGWREAAALLEALAEVSETALEDEREAYRRDAGQE